MQILSKINKKGKVSAVYRRVLHYYFKLCLLYI